MTIDSYLNRWLILDWVGRLWPPRLRPKAMAQVPPCHAFSKFPGRLIYASHSYSSRDIDTMWQSLNPQTIHWFLHASHIKCYADFLSLIALWVPAVTHMPPELLNDRYLSKVIISAIATRIYALDSSLQLLHSEAYHDPCMIYCNYLV